MAKRLMLAILLTFVAVAAFAQDCQKCDYYSGGTGDNPAPALAQCFGIQFGDTGYDVCAGMQTDCHNGTVGPCAPHCHLGGRHCEAQCPDGYEYNIVSGQCHIGVYPGGTFVWPTIRYWYYYGGAGGGLDPNYDDCEHSTEGCWSPLLINLDKGPYRLTSAADGVQFDIGADGVKRQIGWTAAGSNQVLLACDFNNNGRIDSGSELFGNHTPVLLGHATSNAANGFVALESFDNNHDGIINSADAIWSHLLLWNDLNHDGESQPAELSPITTSRISDLGLDYKASRRTDGKGNVFRYRATVRIGDRAEEYDDVYFATAP
jgi:hypothetical protein